eukprot:6794478-Lingulodinium_polyedra.AAC.1
MSALQCSGTSAGSKSASTTSPTSQAWPTSATRQRPRAPLGPSMGAGSRPRRGPPAAANAPPR